MKKKYKQKSKKKYTLWAGIGIVILVALALLAYFQLGNVNSSTNVQNTQVAETSNNDTDSSVPDTKPIEQGPVSHPKVAIPTDCDTSSFDESSPTPTNLGELELSILGEWRGCVSTPWMPKYLISILFKEDGTYSSTLLKHPPNITPGSALYYGTDKDSSEKTFAITGFDTNINTGMGNLVVYFDTGTKVTQGLPDIKVMGNKLSFSYYHFNQYGPLKFELVRVNQN